MLRFRDEVLGYGIVYQNITVQIFGGLDIDDYYGR
jgi:hypothetical protein